MASTVYETEICPAYPRHKFQQNRENLFEDYFTCSLKELVFFD